MTKDEEIENLNSKYHSALEQILEKIKIIMDVRRENEILKLRSKNQSESFKGEIGLGISESIASLKSENVDLKKIVDAASALVNCKGRYHAEQNMIALAELIKRK